MELINNGALQLQRQLGGGDRAQVRIAKCFSRISEIRRKRMSSNVQDRLTCYAPIDV
jgi:hypothetical protein